MYRFDDISCIYDAIDIFWILEIVGEVISHLFRQKWMTIGYLIPHISSSLSSSTSAASLEIAW
jgi:hypothetical protein